MNRLFKYILLLIIAACGLACSEEVDLTTYKALEIEYVTSNRQAISNLRQWYGGDSYSIIADTYQENSNRGSLFVYPDVSTFGLWFQGCENLTEVYIPGGISSIGVRAFEKCTNLKSVTIPESLSYIGLNAFKECESLESITIPEKVNNIGPDAFWGCSDLERVYCKATTPPVLEPDGDTYQTFRYNAVGRKIYVPSKSIIAYRNAKGWSEYADAIVGYNFETGEVDNYEYKNNKIYYTNGSTTTPTQPNNTSVFDANIVSNMYDSLSKCWVITFDADITTIGYNAFLGCSSLTSVTIPESVTTIRNSAFRECKSLVSFDIPDSVTTIEDNAFLNCSSLTSVYCAATTPPSLGGDYVFGGNASDRKIYVHSQSVTAYKNASGWSSYADAIVGYNFETGEVDKDPLDELTNNKIYYTNDSTTTPTQPYSESAFDANIVSNRYDSSLKCWAITFDADLTLIGDYAFYNCDSLTSVTISDSVTTIGNRAFYNCSSLTSVTIGDSVTTIGDYAFYDCYSLTSITIPDSVMTIGVEAFRDCSSLTSVYCEATIPPSLGEYYVFYNNASGRKIYVPAESIETYKSAEGWSDYVDAIVGYNFETGEEVMPDEMRNRVIYYTATRKVEAYSDYPWTFDTFGANVVSNEWNSKTGEGVITFDGDVTTIGNWAFYNCDSLKSVTMPDGVTTIGDYAFYNCDSLTSITIPDSVTTIGNYAFCGCDSLTSVTIPDSVTIIGDSAFSSCDSLTSVTIGDSVTTIGDSAFRDCSSLTSVTIGDSVTTIGDLAFDNCTSLTSVTIPDSVTTIGEAAFSDCTSLTSVTIGDSVTTIGDGAFDNCTSLTSVTIPDSVTTIGDKVFSYCESLAEFKGKFAEDNGRILVIDGILVVFAPAGLTEYAIPDSVTTIGEYAFSGCDSLTSVTIPDSVTTIGDYAFSDCSSLTSVYCAATTPPSLGGDSVFGDNASDRKIYVPAASVEAYKTAYYWSSYANAIVGYDFETGEEVTPEEMRNRVIYYTATAKVEAYSDYPWTFDTFGANILSHDFNEESGEGVITFDADVTRIDSSAFRNCEGGLISIVIPNSVTVIGNYAFVGCDDLVSIDFGEGVTWIGNAAFSGCESLASVVLPDSVETIRELAFINCSRITSVIIGKSVGRIEASAFEGCESLVSVYCKPNTPPSAYLGQSPKWYAFSDNASNRKIYVPTQSVTTYKQKSGWSEYADAIVGYDFNTTITPDGGIDDAEEDDEVIL